MSQEYVDAVRRSIDGWNRDDFDMEMTDMGDTVVVLARTRALGDASGVEFEQLIAYVYEFEDGMARRVRSYHDPDRAFEAVGLRR